MKNDVKLTPCFFIRHAPAIQSKEGLYKNHNVDAKLPSLSKLKSMAKHLPKNALWFVSPLERAKTTAHAICDVMREEPEFKITPEISEQDFGDWQGLDFNELWEKIEGLEAHNWSLLAASTCPPNGESFEEVVARVEDFMVTLATTEPERPKVIVSHAGVIKASIAHVMDLSPDQALSIDIEPFSITQILHQTGNGLGGAWQLRLTNRTF